jgi:hypothetical protein
MNSSAVITVRGPRFWSKRDEKLFDFWLESVPSVAHWGGSGSDLLITLTSKRPPRRDLAELKALFTRYDLDLRALGTLPGTRDRWFRDPEGYFTSMVTKSSRPRRRPGKRR